MMPSPVAPEALRDFIAALFVAYGASRAQAASVARHMVWCEMVGRQNWGLARVAIHLKRIGVGVLTPQNDVTVETVSASIARIDGGGGFGYHAAERAMEYAIDLALNTGIGIVGVRNSNFFGAGAYYVNMAAEASMIGFAMSNSVPHVVAYGGLRPVLGTNPFAFGAPRRKGVHLLIDMATSSLAGSTVREYIAKGKSLPEGLAIDAAGKSITDPAKVSEGALLPFGGPKGFGLSLMVEMLAGIITGAGVSKGVASLYKDFARNGDNGHFLLALDVARWMDLDSYHTRFEGLVAAIKASGDGVLLPGEVRWENYRKSMANGVVLEEQTAETVAGLAAQVKITPPWAPSS
jgi:ureidoglycolate dehydrogenase (NAD+)